MRVSHQWFSGLSLSLSPVFPCSLQGQESSYSQQTVIRRRCCKLSVNFHSSGRGGRAWAEEDGRYQRSEKKARSKSAGYRRFLFWQIQEEDQTLLKLWPLKCSYLLISLFSYWCLHMVPCFCFEHSHKRIKVSTHDCTCTHINSWHSCNGRYQEHQGMRI